jgi:ribosomal protein S18 acetylase RimI-like enzyme
VIVALDPVAAAPALLRLQRDAYAVEAELIGVDSLPPMEEDADALLAAGLTWLGAREDGTLVGAVAYQRRDDLVDIHRLVVHPRAFRRGVATRLLDALEARERAGGPVRRLVVGTGARNRPAIELYRRRGFRITEQREVAPGVAWVRLDRRVPG